MILSRSPATVTKSSLEEMLESLRRQDEALERSKDLPPALPSRPTSRARLPSARHSLPTDFKVGSNGQLENRVKIQVELQVNELKEDTKSKTELNYKISFGSKKSRNDCNSKDSNPYMEDKSQLFNSAAVDTDWDDNILYFIKKKLGIWCHLSNGKWELGHIQSTSGDQAVVSLSGGNFMKVSTSDLLPANPDIIEGVDDLIRLSYLNEPSVVHNLKYRYSQNMIYSKAGPVLIAVNPYSDVPLYGDEIISAYHHKLIDSPHVYAVAANAYDEMMRDGKNQSIIISGESGAGKTETAKHAMQFLAALGGGSNGIEDKILQSSYVLEAFGNAKTSRNSNSSRFGKLIEIHFSNFGKLCGAEIQTFLLEKSTVVQVASGERSYHIFYQLCAGIPSKLRERLNIKMASAYNYLNLSDCLVIDGVDDAKNFSKLMEALDIVQISKADQEQAFAMLAAILWLGNISFQVIDNENHVEVVEDEAIINCARLMGCSMEELMQALSTNKIKCGKDNILKTFTFQQAIDTRDALAKFIYASLFDWLVEQINKSLAVGKMNSEKSINILDICGFESFKNNSFEQFCINYANERLQQHFNRHLFKLEQEECEDDGIDWTKVDFTDNQECLDLFEKKPVGLLSLLDEESNLPSATDLNFVNKLRQHLNCFSSFKAEKARAFAIHHYAGQVVYDASGFLEKYRDPLRAEFFQLLSSSSCQLLKLFSSRISDESTKSASPLVKSGGLDSLKQSVATKFKGQLFKLMHQLEMTTPHFIRSIRPNTEQLAGIYDDDLVLQQLRYCGVLEAVRTSRSGYPARISHQDFAQRYGLLLVEKNVSQDPLSMSVAILQQFNVPPEMYQVGYTKVFLRTGQIAKMEQRRMQAQQGILAMQKSYRSSRACRDFNELRKSATILQSFVRGENDRRTTIDKLAAERQMLATIFLQSVIRGWLARKQLSDKRKLKQSTQVNTNPKRKQGKKNSEVKVMPQEQVEAQASVLTELQKKITAAETTLQQKEAENTTLQEQLQLYERRWSEYEAKMKTMEETWQMQMESLQVNLAAARKSLATENTTLEAGKLLDFRATSPLSPPDSEDNFSMGLQTPTPGATTPNKISVAIGRETNGPVSILANEFEQHTKCFDDDVRTLVEVQASQHKSPDEELRKLRSRFESWKKEYKVKIREAKVKIGKLHHSESDRRGRKWWVKIGHRGLKSS